MFILILIKVLLFAPIGVSTGEGPQNASKISKKNKKTKGQAVKAIVHTAKAIKHTAKAITYTAKAIRNATKSTKSAAKNPPKDSTDDKVSRKKTDSPRVSKKYRHRVALNLSLELGKDDLSFFMGPLVKIHYMHSPFFGMEYSIGAKYANFLYTEEEGKEINRKMYHLGISALWFPQNAFKQGINWYLKGGLAFLPGGVDEISFYYENGDKIYIAGHDGYAHFPLVFRAGAGIKWNRGWYGWFVEFTAQLPLVNINWVATGDTTKYEPSYGGILSGGFSILF
jgi:hypothetical protein